MRTRRARIPPLMSVQEGHATPLFGEVNSPISPPEGSRAPKVPETRGALDASRRATTCPPPSRYSGWAPSPLERIPPLILAFVAFILLTPAGCVKRHFISWADVTLRNYRDFPGLTISADEWKRSAKLFAEAAKKGSKNRYEARRLFCEGKSLQAEGQVEGALLLFKQASELDPSWALPFEAIGSIELEKGGFEKAKTMFEEASEADPMWTSPLADLGVTYHHLNEPLKALQYFDKAVAIDPSQGYLHSNRGNILTTLGRYDEALKAHMEAINLEPQNPIFYLNMAATLDEIKDLENELWVEQKLKDLLPEQQKLVVTLKVAKILNEMERYDEALSELKKALAMSPESKSVKDELKKFYFDRKLFAHLINFILENAKPGCKKCAQECYDLGNILLTEGNLEGAQEAYEAAIKLKPEWTGPVHNLGVVYYRRHDYQKAIDLFQQVLETEKDDVSSILNTGMGQESDRPEGRSRRGPFQSRRDPQVRRAIQGSRRRARQGTGPGARGLPHPVAVRQAPGRHK
jgi:tetratricopeptide (TPR) repeat protein